MRGGVEEEEVEKESSPIPWSSMGQVRKLNCVPAASDLISHSPLPAFFEYCN